MNRRDFLANASITSLGFLTLSRCSLNLEEDDLPILNLVKDSDGYLDLPKGFTYKIISRTGDQMSDGLFVPGRPDGMGAFLDAEGRVRIVRNHENSPGSDKDGAFGLNNEKLDLINSEKLYDLGNGINPGLGGTTTIVYDEQHGVVTREFLSLAGTNRNCAGGITPWKSWLSCEEDVTKSDDIQATKDHGYVFDVPALANELVDAKPIIGMGRFNHEALAVDPESHIVYMTEDRPDGLIYRYVPIDKHNLHKGGKLQVLAIKDSLQLDTRNWNSKIVQLYQPLEVEWLQIGDVEAPLDDLRYHGYDLGAARFARGEGMWMGDQEVYFACTNGGPHQFGQIFKYEVHTNILRLFIESEDQSILHMCDNLTVSPHGLVFLCEDNRELNRIHYINRAGQLRLFAINRSSDSELAGVVFSPSGKTLFVNIQENGETVAITGPWYELV